jgi:hypothetical protein
MTCSKVFRPTTTTDIHYDIHRPVLVAGKLAHKHPSGASNHVIGRDEAHDFFSIQTVATGS